MFQLIFVLDLKYIYLGTRFFVAGSLSEQNFVWKSWSVGMRWICIEQQYNVTEYGILVTLWYMLVHLMSLVFSWHLHNNLEEFFPYPNYQFEGETTLNPRLWHYLKIVDIWSVENKILSCLECLPYPGSYFLFFLTQIQWIPHLLLSLSHF